MLWTLFKKDHMYIIAWCMLHSDFLGEHFFLKKKVYPEQTQSFTIMFTSQFQFSFLFELILMGTPTPQPIFFLESQPAS